MHNYSLSDKQQLDNMEFADFVAQHISGIDYFVNYNSECTLIIVIKY